MSRSTPQAPYHPGELEVQRRFGVEDDARDVAGMLGTTLPPFARRVLAEQPMAVAASLDASGQVWASLLTGPRGFVSAIDDSLLLIAARPAPHDPLLANLAARPELGLIVIDLEKRRRLRFNGRGLHDPERGIFLTLEQAYGNCPKYIQSRRLEPVPVAAAKAEARRSAVLDAGAQALIAQADTFFIASHHPQAGADASHRGGAPGFVHVVDERTLEFPDYPGNNMFNTLGNLAAQPRAGLLFLDFETGDTLQLAGHTRLDWNAASIAAHRGAEGVVVRFDIDAVIATPGGGVRGRLLEYSPVNP